MTLRQIDRKGNVKRSHLPATTSEMKQLIQQIEDCLEQKMPIFYEDLTLNYSEIYEYGPFDLKTMKEIRSSMLGMVQANPKKNNKAYLRKHLESCYGKNRCSESS